MCCEVEIVGGWLLVISRLTLCFYGKQNLWLKLVDIVLQLVTLHQVFEAGFPVSLCYAYSALVAANCFSYAVVILNHERLSAFSEVLVDTVYVLLSLLLGCFPGSQASLRADQVRHADYSRSANLPADVQLLQLLL